MKSTHMILYRPSILITTHYWAFQLSISSSFSSLHLSLFASKSWSNSRNELLAIFGIETREVLPIEEICCWYNNINIIDGEQSSINLVGWLSLKLLLFTIVGARCRPVLLPFILAIYSQKYHRTNASPLLAKWSTSTKQTESLHWALMRQVAKHWFRWTARLC